MKPFLLPVFHLESNGFFLAYGASKPSRQFTLIGPLQLWSCSVSELVIVMRAGNTRESEEICRRYLRGRKG